MKILIVDVAGNKQFKGQEPESQEMIEFGAMLFNTETNQGVVGTTKLIRPTLNWRLTDYCTETTGIDQNEIAQLGERYLDFVDSIDNHMVSQNIDAWAFWCKNTRKILDAENSRWHVSPDFYYKPNIYLRKLFADQYNCGKLKLKQALDVAGIDGVNTSTAYLRASCAAMLARHIDFSEVKL